jgi:hypothetical protein
VRWIGVVLSKINGYLDGFGHAIAVTGCQGRFDNPFPPGIMPDVRGAVAQLGERYNRTVEAKGSTPFSSTWLHGSALTNQIRGCSSAGRAPQWHCGGQGFKSLQLHQTERKAKRDASLFDSSAGGVCQAPGAGVGAPGSASAASAGFGVLTTQPLWPILPRCIISKNRGRDFRSLRRFVQNELTVHKTSEVFPNLLR